MLHWAYPLYLTISRWLLPALSLIMAGLCIKGSRAQKPEKKTLARFVTREGVPLTLTVAEGLVGNKKHCDVYIPAATVEKKHALFFQQDKKWWLTPLEGEVFLNEKPLEDTACLLDGDLVAFGDEEYIFILQFFYKMGHFTHHILFGLAQYFKCQTGWLCR